MSCMRIKNAAMHRLQSVTHIRQRAADDDRHRIIEIRSPHLLFNVDGLYVAGGLATAVTATEGKLWILFVCHLTCSQFPFPVLPQESRIPKSNIGALDRAQLGHNSRLLRVPSEST